MPRSATMAFSPAGRVTECDWSEVPEVLASCTATPTAPAAATTPTTARVATRGRRRDGWALIVVDMMVTSLPAGRSGSLVTHTRRKTRLPTSGKFLLFAYGDRLPCAALRRSVGVRRVTQRSGGADGSPAPTPRCGQGSHSPTMTFPPLLEYSK